MLTPYRVIDLTDERGQLAGAILAQLGAEVIAVEPPGGTSSRHRRPYAHDAEDAETSLWHWAYNRGKRSVVLDLTEDGDRGDFDRLVASADIVLDSGAVEVDLAALRAAHPQLVTVSITPYGDDGPHAERPATDLTVWASAGYAALSQPSKGAPGARASSSLSDSGPLMNGPTMAWSAPSRSAASRNNASRAAATSLPRACSVHSTDVLMFSPRVRVTMVSSAWSAPASRRAPP